MSPRPPQPKPYPGDVGKDAAGRVPFHREYRDAAGRLMRSGTVTVARAGSAAAQVGLVDGALHVELAPGTYHLTVVARTADGVRFASTEQVTIPAPQ